MQRACITLGINKLILWLFYVIFNVIYDSLITGIVFIMYFYSLLWFVDFFMNLALRLVRRTSGTESGDGLSADGTQGDCGTGSELHDRTQWGHGHARYSICRGRHENELYVIRICASNHAICWSTVIRYLTIKETRPLIYIVLIYYVVLNIVLFWSPFECKILHVKHIAASWILSMIRTEELYPWGFI